MEQGGRSKVGRGVAGRQSKKDVRAWVREIKKEKKESRWRSAWSRGGERERETRRQRNSQMHQIELQVALNPETILGTAESPLPWKRHHCRLRFNLRKPVKLT